MLKILVTFTTWNVDCFNGQAPKDRPLKPDQKQSLALWDQMCAISIVQDGKILQSSQCRGELATAPSTQEECTAKQGEGT